MENLGVFQHTLFSLLILVSFTLTHTHSVENLQMQQQASPKLR